MAGQCYEAFDLLATALGDFTCHGASPVVHVRNPLTLSNWIGTPTAVVGVEHRQRRQPSAACLGADDERVTLYLAVPAVLWATAPPDYLVAVDGVTPDGTPTGSLVYAGTSFIAAGACVAATATTRQLAPVLLTRL